MPSRNSRTGLHESLATSSIPLAPEADWSKLRNSCVWFESSDLEILVSFCELSASSFIQSAKICLPCCLKTAAVLACTLAMNYCLLDVYLAMFHSCSSTAQYQ